jgi:hypothetical protein
VGKYIGSWKIDDILQHKVQTSSFTTGAAIDADSVPTWRLYEDGTTTPVTTGSYTTFNSMAGFYNAAITLAAAIGYEKGKNYYIRYSATVASVIGADVDTFQIEAEVDSNSVSVTVNANVSSITAGAITANAFTAGALQALTVGTLLGSVTVNATAAAAIVDGVWDEPKSGHTTADTYGEYLDATISGIAAGDTTVSATAAAAIADAVWAETASGYTTAGSFGYILNSTDTLGSSTFASAVENAVWNASGSSHTSAGSFGARLNVSVNSMTAGAIGAVTVGSTSAAAILAAGSVTVSATAAAAIADAVWDEPKLGHTTADTYGEYLDATVSAIKSKTDSLTFTVANVVDANISHVDGTAITAGGTGGQGYGAG